MSGRISNPVESFGEPLIHRTYDWVGRTWRTLPRWPTLFEPIVGDLIDSAKSIREAPSKSSVVFARVAMQHELEYLRSRSVEENLWGQGTKIFTNPFFQLPDPGQKEGFVAILLASVIANNLEKPQITFSKSELGDKLGSTIKEYEAASIRKWLQTTWQCRFGDIRLGTNSSLKWDATANVITASVKELFGDKSLSEVAISDEQLDNLRRSIHNKMRAEQLWKDDRSGIVYHDVDFDKLGFNDPHTYKPDFHVPFMHDNYTILALVGLIPKSEYKIVE